MDTEPPTHKPLNQKQLSVLELLYRFRFATTELLTQTLGTANKGKMNQRLKLLFDQEYIGRKYEKSYHLTGRHASYYLEAKGIKALRSFADTRYSSSVLTNMYKDKDASDRFINHWLKLFETYTGLKDIYSEKLKFITKSQLSNYKYFPEQLPDAYIRVAYRTNEKHYFLELIESSQPFFVQINKIKNYIKYEEEGDWEEATGTGLPAALFICDTAAQAEKLMKYADREIDDFDSDESPIMITFKGGVAGVLDA